MVLHLDAEDEMVVGDWVVYAGNGLLRFSKLLKIGRLEPLTVATK